MDKFHGISREQILKRPVEETHQKIKFNLMRSTSEMKTNGELKQTRFMNKRDSSFGSQPISIQKFLDQQRK